MINGRMVFFISFSQSIRTSSLEIKMVKSKRALAMVIGRGAMDNAWSPHETSTFHAEHIYADGFVPEMCTEEQLYGIHCFAKSMLTYINKRCSSPWCVPFELNHSCVVACKVLAPPAPIPFAPPFLERGKWGVQLIAGSNSLYNDTILLWRQNSAGIYLAETFPQYCSIPLRI
jgi:hypothetical protein